MATMFTTRAGKSQIGYCTNPSTGYATAGGDLTFATGLYCFSRMKIWIPRGATINTALLKMQVIAKNNGTAQTIYNSFRAHASGDSEILTQGSLVAQRPWTAARVEWTFPWPVNPTADVTPSINVAPIVNEIIARSDYQPGGYITFMLYTDNENGSDLSVRANNDFAMTWELTVDYTENYGDLRTSVNLMDNPNLEALSAIDPASPLPFWGQNPFFGAMVGEAPNLGTIARDTTFTRLPGVPTLRFTTGTPPTENTGRSTGPYSSTHKQNELPYIFAGWIYIPSIITTQVHCGDPYLNKSHMVTERNQWVPFCSTPTDLGTGRTAFWPCVSIRGPWPGGAQIWISEPTVMVSPFRQMPFNGYTPDVKDPGLVTLVDHKYHGSGQGASREWTPRTSIVREGLLRKATRYIKRTDDILQLAEPIKGGPTVPNMPAIAISSYPAGKTISEL